MKDKPVFYTLSAARFKKFFAVAGCWKIEWSLTFPSHKQTACLEPTQQAKPSPTMYDFMEYCLRRYYRASGWNEDNQYSNLCSWSRSLLDFEVPHGISLVMSKLPTSVFKPSYTIDALPSLNGSIAYLYTSRPLDVDTSATVDFKDTLNYIRTSKPLTGYQPSQAQGDR
jgi:hypothetical protein